MVKNVKWNNDSIVHFDSVYDFFFATAYDIYAIL